MQAFFIVAVVGERVAKLRPFLLCYCTVGRKCGRLLLLLFTVMDVFKMRHALRSHILTPTILYSQKMDY